MLQLFKLIFMKSQEIKLPLVCTFFIFFIILLPCSDIKSQMFGGQIIRKKFPKTFSASLSTSSTLSNSTNGVISNIPITSAIMNSSSNPSLLANNLFDANGDFIAPYAGVYTFTFKTWSGNLSGTPRWDFFSISNNVRANIFTETRIPTGSQVVLNYTLVQGQKIVFRHQSCWGCNPTTNTNFGNVKIDVTF